MVDDSEKQCNCIEDGRFNYIYHQLVEDENDIIGHVAYSIYKECKIKFVKNYTQKEGKFPDDSVINIFHKTSIESKQFYLDRATAVLQSFSNEALQEAFEEMKEEYLEEQDYQIKESIKAAYKENKDDQSNLIKDTIKELNKELHQKTFFSNSYASAVGAIWYTIGIALIVFILSLSTGKLRKCYEIKWL